ncbi:MAG: fluoride efflux transporter CrcB [Dehalococcoidia bacterium]|nr:fluoride efflux transporter CrcB [Dehalococcoidia bacterium]
MRLELVLLVALGGMLGSVARYLVSPGVQSLLGGPAFPMGTLVVNLAGCFLIGLINGFAQSRGLITPPARAFLVVGVLGGFTTFSAFGYETFALAKDGSLPLAMLNAAAQLLLGVGAVWAADQVAQGL